MTFLNDELQTNLFMGAVVSELVKNKLLPLGKVSQSEIDRVREALITAAGIYDNPELFEDHTQAVVHIQKFIADTGWRGPKDPVEIVTISATLTVPYGRAQIAFNINASYDPEVSLPNAMIFLQTKLVEAYKSAVPSASFAQESKGNNDYPNTATASYSNTEQIDIRAIRVMERNGQRQYKVVGGKYEKYGVPIYDEVIVGFMPNYRNLYPGDNPCSGRAIIELNQQGRPNKVVQIYSR